MGFWEVLGISVLITPLWLLIWFRFIFEFWRVLWLASGSRFGPYSLRDGDNGCKCNCCDCRDAD